MKTTLSQWQALLSDLHDRPVKIAIVIAGGGSGAVAQCYRCPGASGTFIEAVIPYSRAAMTDYLAGQRVDLAVARETAERLARRAWQRCDGLCDARERDDRCYGLALTAALPTHQPRSDLSSIHVALHDGTGTSAWALQISHRSILREDAEQISDEMIFLALATLVDEHNNQAFWEGSGLTPR